MYQRQQQRQAKEIVLVGFGEKQRRKMNSEIPWEREGMGEIGTVPISPSDQEELLKKAQEAYGKALATRRMKIICPVGK